MKWLAWPLAITVAVSSSTAGEAMHAQSAGSLVQTPMQKKADKIRAEVMRRGVGEKSRVRVKLRDGLKLKGFITRIEEDSFEVQTDPDGLDAPPAKDRLITVRYTDVVKIRGPQSRVARIGTDVGLTIAVVAVLTGLGLLALWKYNREHRY